MQSEAKHLGPPSCHFPSRHSSLHTTHFPLPLPIAHEIHERRERDLSSPDRSHHSSSPTLHHSGSLPASPPPRPT